MKKHSWLGFLLSLAFHGGLLGGLALIFVDKKAEGQPTEMVATHISMEMMMATTIEQSEPMAAVEVDKVAVEPPKPELKEMVADPLLKPKPEKPKKHRKEHRKERSAEEPKERKERREKAHRKEPKTEKPPVEAVPKEGIKAKAIVAGNAQITSKSSSNAANGNVQTSSAANASEIAAYESRLRREIERHKKYSQRAKMMRKQGLVVIAFNIGGDGSISGARVLKSSGSEDLDNSALQAVQNAKSVGARPAGMSSSSSVPVNFRIQ